MHLVASHPNGIIYNEIAELLSDINTSSVSATLKGLTDRNELARRKIKVDSYHKEVWEYKVPGGSITPIASESVSTPVQPIKMKQEACIGVLKWLVPDWLEVEDFVQ